MKNHFKVTAVILSAIVCLCGCQANTMPELSEDETNLVAQYAANLILTNNSKHDTGIATQEEIAKDDAKRERQRLREEQAKAAAESANDSTSSITASEGNASEAADVDIAEFLGLSDILIKYQDYEIMDAYPNDGSEDDFFAMNASEGNRLLVVRFTMQNNSAEDRDVDILYQYPVFKVSINGNSYKSALTTLLLDDMSTFNDTILAGETITEVLVIEISDQEAETGIQSLTLQTKFNDQTGNTVLF